MSSVPKHLAPKNATAIVIPARFASTRFPGKPLHLLAGKPMLRHVWERCLECRVAGRVIIATDDIRIQSAAIAFGADVVMTRTDHPTGTDRIVEVLQAVPEIQTVLNVQGDEPLAPPELMERLLLGLQERPACDMITAAVPTEDSARMTDPNVVKVVTSTTGRALYFSRASIPYDRSNAHPAARFLWHKGIYGYRREFLLKFVAWPASPLEQSEQLEQLRALENGAYIHVLETDDIAPGVDTPEQAAEVEALMLQAARTL